jgi:hypothetical protein
MTAAVTTIVTEILTIEHLVTLSFDVTAPIEQECSK